MSQIYLISPPQIELKTFSKRLESALRTTLVPVFQLRLKNYFDQEVKNISRELKKICHANNCLFLLNDYCEIALDIGADGVHLGAEDGSILSARNKSPKNFIIGASCYDSRDLAILAAEQGADYLSFGAFFSSNTKKSRGNPSLEILEWSKDRLSLPIVAIGGVTDQNCNSIVKSGADFLSVISYVWDHPCGEKIALQNLHQAIVGQ
jgi:thiamine-phosphate pyrophosphorylase